MGSVGAMRKVFPSSFHMRSYTWRPTSDPSPSCPFSIPCTVEDEYVKGRASISREDGRAIFDELSNGGTVTVLLPSNPASGHDSVTNTDNLKTCGVVSSFPSWGPSLDIESMSSFVAPRENPQHFLLLENQAPEVSLTSPIACDNPIY